jgi:hypothetical protein
MRVFKGTYQKYLAVLDEEKANGIEPPRVNQRQVTTSTTDDAMKNMETQILSLQGELEELETLLAHASKAGNGETISNLTQKYKEQQQRLEALTLQRDALLTQA